MAPTSEKGLVNAIVHGIGARWPSAWLMKVHGGGYQTSGIPDLLVCVQGRFVALEVKFQRPGESAEHARERATVGQQVQIRKLTGAGAVARVVISVDEAIAAVEDALSR